MDVVDRRLLVDVIKSGFYAVCLVEILLTIACVSDRTDEGALTADDDGGGTDDGDCAVSSERPAI